MIINREIQDFSTFEFWDGGKYAYDTLTVEQLDTLFRMIEEEYPDGIDEAELNDLFWFDRDYLADLLGFEDWEHLERFNEGEQEIKVKISDIEWMVDEDSVDLPTEIIHTFETLYRINEDEFYDEVTDWLSDEYGCLVVDYCMKEVE